MAELDSRADCVCFQLHNHGLVFLNIDENTVFVDVFWFEIGGIFHGVDGSLLVGCCEGIVVGKYFILVGGSTFANDFDLELTESINFSILRLNEHSPLALLIPNLGWRLNQGKLL